MGGQVLHAFHLLYDLSDNFSLSSGFSFGFGCNSLACKEGIPKLEHLLEAKGYFWLLVGTFVKEVRVDSV